MSSFLLTDAANFKGIFHSKPPKAQTAGPTNVQTMPREITWHPELQQLVFSPVEEQNALRVKRGCDSSSFITQYVMRTHTTILLGSAMICLS